MRNQGSDDGGKSQGGEESRRIQVGTQSTARTNAPGIFEGGRRHGGDLAGGRQMEMETEDQGGAKGVEGESTHQGEAGGTRELGGTN